MATEAALCRVCSVPMVYEAVMYRKDRGSTVSGCCSQECARIEYALSTLAEIAEDFGTRLRDALRGEGR